MSSEETNDVLVRVALLPVSVVAWGITDMNLWNWFIAPLGVMELSFVHALGLGLATSTLSGVWSLGLLEHQLQENGVIEYKRVIRSILGISVALVYLGIGFIIHLFM